MNIEIKELSLDEYPQAYDLVWEVFCRFNKKEYSDEGVQSFRRFLDGGEIEARYRNGEYIMLMCLADGEPAAVGGMRDGNHISLLFTREKFQRMGLASLLVKRLKSRAAQRGFSTVTVNASPSGIPFYRAAGFIDVSCECISEGIRYTPMTASALK